jgi:hypothetical protein
MRPSVLSLLNVVALGKDELLGFDPTQGLLCEALLEIAHRTGVDGRLKCEMRHRLHWSGSLEFLEPN